MTPYKHSRSLVNIHYEPARAVAIDVIGQWAGRRVSLRHTCTTQPSPPSVIKMSRTDTTNSPTVNGDCFYTLRRTSVSVLRRLDCTLHAVPDRQLGTTTALCSWWPVVAPTSGRCVKRRLAGGQCAGVLARCQLSAASYRQFNNGAVTATYGAQYCRKKGAIVTTSALNENSGPPLRTLQLTSIRRTGMCQTP